MALQGETFYEGDNPLDESDGSDKDKQEGSDSDSFAPVSSNFNSDAGSENEDADGRGNSTRGITHSTPKPKAPKASKVGHSVVYTNNDNMWELIKSCIVFHLPLFLGCRLK